MQLCPFLAPVLGGSFDAASPGPIGGTTPAAGTFTPLTVGAAGSQAILEGDAANVLALRNSANAQVLRVYNTFTDAANYERGQVGWSANDFIVGVEAAGTGSTTRQLHLRGGTSGTVRIGHGSNTCISVGGSGVGVTNPQIFSASATQAGTAGGVASRTQGNKAVTGIANAVATDILTVTIPNAAHHAVLEIEVQGALGAGGAIGAGSAMATNTYKIAIVRTAGVATVATATAATHAVAVAVAGSETVTATAAVTAMTGPVGATQTFTVQITISRSGGAATNHTCLVTYKLTNANASGITIA